MLEVAAQGRSWLPLVEVIAVDYGQWVAARKFAADRRAGLEPSEL